MKQLALVGYGKMGRLLHQLAPEAGFEVKLTLDAGDAIAGRDFTGIDAVIEFTEPSAAVDNLLALAAAGVPTVCGTTGWLDRFDEVAAAYRTRNGALVYGANFSIGVQLFARLCAEAAALFAPHGDYEAWAWEMHHSAKKDAPSGTLLMLVDRMRASGFSANVDIAASRAGRVPGTHEIGFDSAADTITLRHTARSREGFARGALFAANWIAGRRGVYDFREALFGAPGDNHS
jgi:4-hydroxy-tetrahydrodipicolinate reductase